jgi:hypothetical protein
MINQGSSLYKITCTIAKKRGLEPKEFLQQLMLEEYKRIFKKEYMV